MKKIVRDQIGSKVVVPALPTRIVSLVPSITEYLVDIGLGSRLIGITKYCNRPESVQNGRSYVGGTKKFDFDKIGTLKPDLIIANKEENYQSGIETLRESYPVWVSDINTLSDALTAMRDMAEICGQPLEGKKLCDAIEIAFALKPVEVVKPRVCYLIWRNPWMACGCNNFIDAMLEHAGYENVFKGHTDRYPAVTIDKIAELEPDYIFLSSEPFPFGDQHVDELKHLLPRSSAVIVDAEPFSWYGSRLKYSVSYFDELKKRLLND